MGKDFMRLGWCHEQVRAFIPSGISLAISRASCRMVASFQAQVWCPDVCHKCMQLVASFLGQDLVGATNEHMLLHFRSRLLRQSRKKAGCRVGSRSHLSWPKHWMVSGCMPQVHVVGRFFYWPKPGMMS